MSALFALIAGFLGGVLFVIAAAAFALDDLLQQRQVIDVSV